MVKVTGQEVKSSGGAGEEEEVDAVLGAWVSQNGMHAWGGGAIGVTTSTPSHCYRRPQLVRCWHWQECQSCHDYRWHRVHQKSSAC